MAHRAVCRGGAAGKPAPFVLPADYAAGMASASRLASVALALLSALVAGCQAEAPVSSAPAAAGGPAAKKDWPEPDDAVLEQLASTLNFNLGTPASAWVSPDGTEVLFRRSGPRSFVGICMRSTSRVVSSGRCSRPPSCWLERTSSSASRSARGASVCARWRAESRRSPQTRPGSSC
jgi:hypothetical protein